MFHVQPSADNQFNSISRAIMWPGEIREGRVQERMAAIRIDTVVTNTGGNAPTAYIMVQSMFEATGGWVTQLLGVRQGAQFTFYWQRARGNAILAERLAWTTWRWWVPLLLGRAGFPPTRETCALAWCTMVHSGAI